MTRRSRKGPRYLLHGLHASTISWIYNYAICYVCHDCDWSLCVEEDKMEVDNVLLMDVKVVSIRRPIVVA